MGPLLGLMPEPGLLPLSGHGGLHVGLALPLLVHEQPLLLLHELLLMAEHSGHELPLLALQVLLGQPAFLEGIAGDLHFLQLGREVLLLQPGGQDPLGLGVQGTDHLPGQIQEGVRGGHRVGVAVAGREEC